MTAELPLGRASGDGIGIMALVRKRTSGVRLGRPIRPSYALHSARLTARQVEGVWSPPGISQRIAKAIVVIGFVGDQFRGRRQGIEQQGIEQQGSTTVAGLALGEQHGHAPALALGDGVQFGVQPALVRPIYRGTKRIGR